MILKDLHYFLWSLPFVSFLAGYSLMYQLFSINTIPTPALVGKQLHEVITVISEKDLTLRLLAIKEETDLPESTILSQKPQAGQLIKPNQSIYIVLSQQPKLTQAPNFIAQSQKSIERVCKKNKIRTKHYTIRSTYPTHKCMGQYPAPGQLIKERHMITYISDGSTKPIVLPNFKGQSLKLVQEFLESYNIKSIITHTNRKSHQSEQYIVVDQRPLAGSLITLNDKKPLCIQLQV